MRRVVLGALLGALLGTGCALTGKSAAIPVRYYTLEAPRAVDPDAAVATTAPRGKLRLGQINAAAYIRDKIVVRRSAHELDFHDTWRWSEDAEAYVHRALARSLFQTHGLTQTLSGPGLTLEVDLDTFEERAGARRTARVELTWRLRDAREVLVQRTVVVERPIGHRKAITGEDVASGLAQVLAEALDHVVVDVLAETTAVASTQPAAP